MLTAVFSFLLILLKGVGHGMNLQVAVATFLLTFCGLILLADSKDTDVVFIVDGSSSIDSKEFQLQKDGIVDALTDPLRVPRDGSIAISVVQFTNYARVELPFQVHPREQAKNLFVLVVF